MRNRLLSIVAMVTLSATLCISCSKEKMPAQANNKQGTTSSADAKYGSSSTDTNSTATEDHRGSCNQGG